MLCWWGPTSPKQLSIAQHLFSLGIKMVFSTCTLLEIAFCQGKDYCSEHTHRWHVHHSCSSRFHRWCPSVHNTWLQPDPCDYHRGCRQDELPGSLNKGKRMAFALRNQFGMLHFKVFSAFMQYVLQKVVLVLCQWPYNILLRLPFVYNSMAYLFNLSVVQVTQSRLPGATFLQLWS